MNRNHIFDAMRTAFQALKPHLGGYHLVVPGDPSFVCLTTSCPAHCCSRYTVNMGEAEVERMQRLSGRSPSSFLESENGVPVSLPLAEPFVLARRDGHCILLRDDLLCGEHEGRPNACRLYPHFLVAFHLGSGRLRYGDAAAVRAAVDATLDGRDAGDFLPILVRHGDCPGFGGPPLAESDWVDLYRETARIQFGLPGEQIA